MLDVHGFELDHHETSLTNEEFEMDQIIRDKYYPEIVSFILKKLGASRVVPFEHTVSLYILECMTMSLTELVAQALAAIIQGLRL